MIHNFLIAFASLEWWGWWRLNECGAGKNMTDDLREECPDRLLLLNKTIVLPRRGFELGDFFSCSFLVCSKEVCGNICLE